MGFFSKLCSVSNLPVMADTTGLGDDASEVVVVFKNGSTLRGVYDGYGRVGGEDLLDDWDNIKFVLRKYYAGQTYAELGKSHDDPGQGFFYDDETIVAWHEQGGFASFEEFVTAWREVSNRGA
jgi:hypothetical protein